MMSEFNVSRATPVSQHKGFTILEVLIALTASLLMMLALTRAFKMIGDKISQSQSELEMSGTLRNITFGMRNELDRMTSDMVAPASRNGSSGYFTYYEGPWADGTTQLINNVGPQAGYLPTSRYGDIDDYFAFTARAKQDAPFVGLIPRGVLEAHRYEAFIAANGLGAAGSFVTADGIGIANYGLANAYELVPFYSSYAEIAYFVAPDWVRDSLGQPTYDGAGNPVFVDVVNEVGGATLGDNIPDRLSLRRRILLVRPDLNMSPKRMYDITGAVLPGAVPGVDEDVDQLPILLPPTGAGAPAQVRPLAPQDTRFQVGPWSPTLQWPGGVLDQDRPTWLTGLARVQQMMDLSVARITNSWDLPYDPTGPTNAGSVYAMPANDSLGGNTPGIAANSLQSLSRPENRFGHVRVPITIGGEPASTMPMLALCPPHPYISAQEDITLANNPGTLTDDRFGQAITPTPVSYGSFTMVGFLRPEFSLTDYTVANRTTAATAATTSSPTYRGGADKVASDILAFDVQVYDPSTPNFVWMGTAPQNLPGNPGFDDDGDGTTDELDELGLPNTDDALVTVNSPAMNPLVGTAPSVFGSTAVSLPAGTSEYLLASSGDFVDFGYLRQGGGMIGGSQVIERLGVVPRNTFGELFSTPYSGLTGSGTLPFESRYPVGWQESGRFVLPGTNVAGDAFALAMPLVGRVNQFCQPVIDTWTESYDGDGFRQESFDFSPPQPVNNFDLTGSAASGVRNGVRTRYWRNSLESLNASGPNFVSGDTAPVESQPPTAVMPRAIKITIRVFDRTAGEIRQQSVVHEFPR